MQVGDAMPSSNCQILASVPQEQVGGQKGGDMVLDGLPARVKSPQLIIAPRG